MVFNESFLFQSMPKYVLPKKSDMFPYSYRMSDPMRNKILAGKSFSLFLSLTRGADFSDCALSSRLWKGRRQKQFRWRFEDDYFCTCQVHVYARMSYISIKKNLRRNLHTIFSFFRIHGVSNKSSPASPGSSRNAFGGLSSSSISPKTTKVTSSESNTSISKDIISLHNERTKSVIFSDHFLYRA